MSLYFFYKTGTSFIRVEDKDLIKAFNICRPGVVIPSRKQLAGPLLDECYLGVKQQVDEHLQSSDSICIVTDGWTNVISQPIVNYMAIATKHSFFIESVSTGDQRYNAEWIANDISCVIDGFTCDVAGAITDNTSANKSAWKILEAMYPDKFFHGCVSHTLHLLLKDIMGSNKQWCPFDTLVEFINKCKEIITFFKNHHALNHQLRKNQKEQNLKSLAMPRYTDEKLEPKLREELEEFIVNFPFDKEIPSQENKIATYRQLMEFFISANGHKTRNSFHYKMLVQEQKSPLEYWLTNGTNWPLLQKIAKKVFSMAVSSTSSERNFSTFGFVHSKLRNQLAPETVKKLVFVKTNIHELDGSTATSFIGEDEEQTEDDPVEEII